MGDDATEYGYLAGSRSKYRALHTLTPDGAAVCRPKGPKVSVTERWSQRERDTLVERSGLASVCWSCVRTLKRQAR